MIRTYDDDLITSYRGTDCMKKFARALKIMAKIIIDTPQKSMTPLTDEENRNHERSNLCHICNEKFIHDKENEKYHEYFKVRDHCHYTGKYRGAAHSKCNLQYKGKERKGNKDIPAVFHNGSKYGYHFIINKLAKGIDGITCLGDDTEKYITFKIPLKKENEDGQLITYKLKFIDIFSFMNQSLSDFVDNLSEINNQECIRCKQRKNESIDCKHIDYANNRLIYKCVECKNISYKPIAPLIERFPSTYQFSSGDNNKFVLLLRKGIYPYEYNDDWDKFKETQLPLMKDFHNTLNQTDITKEDYEHAQKVWNTFNIKNLGEYHDLYVQSDTLLLADIFENFRETCQRIYKLDPTHFLLAPGLAWQACLKMTKVKLELLTDENMLLMVEEGIRGGICQAIHHYESANNKYMKNYNKNVISSYLQYLDANNLYGWAMSKKLPVREFTWAKKPSIYTEEAIKMYNENNDNSAILQVDIEYPTMAHIKHKDLPFLPQRKKINKVHNLVTTLDNKEKSVVHISALKQDLDHGLKSKKLHRVIECLVRLWRT